MELRTVYLAGSNRAVRATIIVNIAEMLRQDFYIARSSDMTFSKLSASDQKAICAIIAID